MTRAAILCPGRGSFTERQLRSLPAEHAWVRRADELRREYGLPTLIELDQAARFSAALHLRPANVSLLIWLRSMLDSATAMQQHEVVCVVGNSMGWYTALAVAGALSFDDGFRLVQEMALAQERHAGGGQVIYPLVDEQWRRDEALASTVRAALASSNGQAFPSIDLGGYTVLAGSEQGVAHLLHHLPPVKLGSNSYPMRLVQHGAYHTPLVQAVSNEAHSKLERLQFASPRTTLVDGRGVRFTPWSTDVTQLVDYTLGAQVVEPFDFAHSVRVALREHAPDHLVLLGPGNTLGGICGQILIAEGWRGLHEKAAFQRMQAAERPFVISMGSR